MPESAGARPDRTSGHDRRQRVVHSVVSRYGVFPLLLSLVAMAACGGSHAPTSSPSAPSSVLQAQTTDTLKPIRVITAARVKEDIGVAGTACRQGIRADASLSQLADHAVLELSFWLRTPDAVPILRPAVARLKETYPTCVRLRQLR
jgi:hypothetical protein